MSHWITSRKYVILIKKLERKMVWKGICIEYWKKIWNDVYRLDCVYKHPFFRVWYISWKGSGRIGHSNICHTSGSSRTNRKNIYEEFDIPSNASKTLLLTEELPISEICQRVGYINTSYFIKLFREATGISPAKYRK